MFSFRLRHFCNYFFSSSACRYSCLQLCNLFSNRVFSRSGLRWIYLWSLVELDWWVHLFTLGYIYKCSVPEGDKYIFCFYGYKCSLLQLESYLFSFRDRKIYGCSLLEISRCCLVVTYALWQWDKIYKCFSRVKYIYWCSPLLVDVHS